MTEYLQLLKGKLMLREAFKGTTIIHEWKEKRIPANSWALPSLG